MNEAHEHYDRTEIITNDNQQYTITSYYKGEQLVKKNTVDSDGDLTQYFIGGKLDRDNDKPAVVLLDLSGFTLKYYKQGVLHRENGPAVEYVKYPHLNEWYNEGKKMSNTQILMRKIKNVRNNIAKVSDTVLKIK